MQAHLQAKVVECQGRMRWSWMPSIPR